MKPPVAKGSGRLTYDFQSPDNWVLVSWGDAFWQRCSADDFNDVKVNNIDRETTVKRWRRNETRRRRRSSNAMPFKLDDCNKLKNFCKSFQNCEAKYSIEISIVQCRGRYYPEPYGKHFHSPHSPFIRRRKSFLILFQKFKFPAQKLMIQLFQNFSTLQIFLQNIMNCNGEAWSTTKAQVGKWAVRSTSKQWWLAGESVVTYSRTVR